MSDTPTAEDRLVAILQDAARILYRAEAEAIIAALRNSPDALTDLNGGEWVQPNNGVHSAWWHDTEPSDEDPPSAVWRCEGFPVNAPPNDNPPPGYRPMFVFVPREATDG